MDKPDISPLFMELFLRLATPPSSKAATETLNGEQKGGGGVDTILDTKGMTYDCPLPSRRYLSSQRINTKSGLLERPDPLSNRKSCRKSGKRYEALQDRTL